MQDAGKTKDTSINAALHCVCPRANWHTDFKRSLPTKESRTKARRKKNEKIRKRIRRLAERQKTGTTTERPAPPAEKPDKWGFDPEEPDVVDAAQGVPAWRRPREALPAWQTHATTEATQIMKSGMHVSNGQSVPAHDSGECALTTEEREGMTTQVNAFVKKGHAGVQQNRPGHGEPVLPARKSTRQRMEIAAKLGRGKCIRHANKV